PAGRIESNPAELNKNGLSAGKTLNTEPLDDFDKPLFDFRSIKGDIFLGAELSEGIRHNICIRGDACRMLPNQITPMAEINRSA
ncbi:hypothetical protein SJ550_26480, partial [Serratia marcescens]